MAIEPADKRTVAFFDGQNLFHAARAAFGYTFPNYDPITLQPPCANSKDGHSRKCGSIQAFQTPVMTHSGITSG
jgi:hypothetical protein